MLRAAARLEATATLAGGIAHQFNNLMFAVMGNAELLQFEFAGRADVRDGLDRIVKSAQRASELAQQLLAFARGGKYQPVVMDLNDTIQEALWSKQQAFPARIGVERDVEPELWRIEADPAQMAQMVVNLCANAVEAIDGTGRVVITTRNLDIKSSFAGAPPDLKPGRYVCFSVEDTGSGMGPDVQARIFEPFFSTKFLGRGLGLAAVYGIVKNHGGHLSVFSQENQGTSFKIYLPAAEILGEASLEPGIPVERETVLVIDDDEMVLSVTQQLLERLGYDVLVAPSGPVALDIARTYEGPIHAAMLDMRMPDMSGPEVFPLLVEARPGIKVLLCSGFDVGATARALLNAGAKAFISKPFQVDALASELRKALEPE
jgi:CheY-like chemotaxis protein